VSINPKVAVAA